MEGRKTVARRLMNPQPMNSPESFRIFKGQGNEGIWVLCKTRRRKDDAIKCRYRPGETVYIRETWAVDKKYDHLPPSEIPIAGRKPVYYKAKDYGDVDKPESAGRWRSPRFMPAWAARSHALIVSVRPERVQEITDDEALSEGFIDIRYAGEERKLFIDLWNSLHPGSWERNDWVWRIEMEKLP